MSIESRKKDPKRASPHNKWDDKDPLHQLEKQPLLSTVNNQKENKVIIRDEVSQLLVLVYPVVFITAMEFFPSLISIILAGHMESTLSKVFVDAVTLSNTFAAVTSYSIGFGLSTALDTLCSQAYGAKQMKKIGIYFQTGVIVVSFCLIPMIFINWYSEWFLLLLGQDPIVAKYTQRFSRLMLPGWPFMFLYDLLRKVLQAQNIMTPLVGIIVIENIVSGLLGYVLTYHTPLEFDGIPIARSIGSIIMPILLVPYFYRYPQHLKQWWGGWDLKAALDHMGLFLQLGLSGFLMMAMEWWAFEILSFLVGNIPNTDTVVALSAHAVAINVASLYYMVSFGLGTAGNIRVGNCLGANTPMKARMAGIISMSMATIFGLFVAGALYGFRYRIPSVFIADPKSVVASAKVLAAWSPFAMLDCTNSVLQGMYRGTGEQHIAAMASGIAFYVIGVPLGAWLGLHAGYDVIGLWVGFGVGLVFLFSVLSIIAIRWNWFKLAKKALERISE